MMLRGIPWSAIIFFIKLYVSASVLDDSRYGTNLVYFINLSTITMIESNVVSISGSFNPSSLTI